MRKILESATVVVLENLISFKSMALILASAFFMSGKLSEGNWVQAFFAVVGARAATDITQISKSGNKTTSKLKVDNPDDPKN